MVELKINNKFLDKVLSGDYKLIKASKKKFKALEKDAHLVTVDTVTLKPSWSGYTLSFSNEGLEIYTVDIDNFAKGSSLELTNLLLFMPLYT